MYFKPINQVMFVCPKQPSKIKKISKMKFTNVCPSNNPTAKIEETDPF